MQTLKAQKSKVNVKTVAVGAMFAALITVATAFIKIPAPSGYAHAGDSFVMLAACALPAPVSFIAAAVGGAMADLLSGYAVWALPTAIIKALVVLPFFAVRILLSKKNKDDRLLRPVMAIPVLLAAAITVGGYFAASVLLYDKNAALAEIPFNIMQCVVSTVLFTALGLALDAIKFKQRSL